MSAVIEERAAGVLFEDQLASEKKCGRLGGKVLVPTSPEGFFHVRPGLDAPIVRSLAYAPASTR